ncbi:TPA_exp: Uncharacterized protein A8136_3714 [Trichophyton benhamiae CBS 112371]|uniref:Carrier domain-containing protein n=1 Tax=Arthroderma benhamiae (strain ATCC MYA-4681 / CBS 112371) TaxID=663331 RepID=D4B197_ARTBC|nr:uncharacterized protein ARB_02226 [Trichophyton benhamiae CBS 112371]EFE31032.1 hypothetical protein ARB_02226 [Trichophyton benhamiae CBS 112371]DAA74216.1 TPA_exp: Uncharacterized protein A8136_3714 [Trichophyton benhamiae CBS 112371]
MTIENDIKRPSNDAITLENGKALNFRKKIPSPHERMYCNGSLDKWRLFISHISERCDLSGLAKACTKYQLALTGFSDVDTHRERQTVTVDVPEEVNTALRDRYIRQGGSLRSIVLFAVHQMLRGFGNGSHTVTASISPDSEHRLSWEVSPTIVSHKNRGQTSVLEAIRNIDISNQRLQSSKDEEIEEETQPNRASRFEEVGSELEGGWMKSELFDLPVVFVKARLDHVMRLSSIDVDFPLAVLVHEGHNDGDLQLAVQFSTALFAPETIQNFTDALKNLLAEASTGPGTLVKDIDLLSAQQIQQLDVWNNTDGDYESSKRLNHLVEDAARHCPDKVAVVCEERELTYGDLNRQANSLARYLCRFVQPEQLIGLFLEKNELLIITILAIWKSGAAYVPIDPAFPDDRVRFVLDDTKANLLIASDAHAARLQKNITSNKDIQVIRLELLLKELTSSAAGEFHDGQNLDHLPLNSRQLAYVTYTSGTTGFPKGIFKEHTSVVNSITDLSVKYGVAGSHHETILLFSAYVFEPFVRQLLMALVNGHLLAIISDVKKYDSDYLLSLIQRHQVTYLNGTASVLQEYDFSTCPSLKRIILVGENLTAARYDSLRQRFKGTILNEYGFTESAFVSALNIFEPHSKRENTSLGRPVRNVKCYILSQELKRTPIGVTGELHIGGLGISRGYLNRPDLTPFKFIPNPFQTRREKELGINRLMYKTGDLARWLPNGEVEYLGRADFQIKLRGIRIEPGEIESTLSMYPNIRTSLVVSRKLRSRGEETANEHLVGYYVCQDNVEVVPEESLLAFLETKLPRYMVPSRLVHLEYIPVNINGKADLKALPVVDLSRPAKGALNNLGHQTEIDLQKIWSDVLGVGNDSISPEDSFFRLGGHSISCIQLIARIRQQFSVSISVEDIFAMKTLSRMAAFLRKKQSEIEASCTTDIATLSSASLSFPVLSGSNSTCYLANSLQQGFIYHYLKNKEPSGTYIMQSLLRYDTELRPDVFQKAWKLTQHAFPALRLRFLWEKDVFQIIDQDQPLNFRFFSSDRDLEGLSSEDKLQNLQKQDLREDYKLDAGELFRVYMIKHDDQHFSSLFSCHHAILDGWSLPLLFQHVHEEYLRLIKGGHFHFDTPIDKAYGHSQNFLQMNRDTHLEYWSGVVEQITERCDMNVLLNEQSRYKIPLANYDQVRDQRQQTLHLDGDMHLRNIHDACSERGITLHSILQFIWHTILHKYGGGSHTVTGTTISGRNLPVEGIEHSVGLYINTLPLVLDHTEYKNKSVLDAMSDVQAKVNAMNTRGHVELGRLYKSNLKHGLFDTLFVFESYPALDRVKELQHQEALHYSIQGNMEKLNYPLTAIVQDINTAAIDTLTFTICYASELFDTPTILELLSMVQDTIKQISSNLTRPANSLEYLSLAQVNQLAEWNATEADFPDATLHQQFELEVDRVPSKTAIIYEDVTLTYHELNERANRMAWQLKREVGIKPDDLVALVLDKSEHMMVSILAVWKSGGAYVPIDPSYPEDRISYILQDTNAVTVIADPIYIPKVEKLTRPGVPIYPSDLATHNTSDWSSDNPPPSSISTSLAYIFYTSGTTGRPKGVMVEHHGVVNLQTSLSRIFGLRETDDEVIFSFSNYVFDHFVEQMTDALLNGQTLLILNDTMRGDKERLYQYMEKNRVTYLSGTPSVISMYEFSRFKAHLRRVDCIGEAFSEPVFDRIRETFQGLIINGYGPTEVSITTHKRLYPFPERRTDKSIGCQIANSTSYVLDEDMKRVPIGAVGELYLGGDGVARGYHNRPDLTADRFPLNPFQTDKEKSEGRNMRLYKTGDLVRWIPGSRGEVEYLGRNDFQVKIRGVRIELGEVEAVLSSYPEIKQSVVVPKKRAQGGQTFLVGYCVSGSTISSIDIKRFMQSRLPDYMVPSRLIFVTKLPVTPSGKLDTKALPAVDESADNEVVAPRTEIERTLREIWTELLEIPLEDISIYSDFFGLGGDSLKSTRLSFMVNECLHRTISVAELFQHRTIEALGRLIVNGIGDIQDIALITDTNKDLSISPAQERVLFLHELEGGNSKGYNITKTLQLSSQTSPSLIEQALRELLSRHEALRTLLQKDAVSGIYHQKILNNNEAQSLFFINTSTVRDLDHLDQKISDASQHIFHLGEELPLRVYMFTGNGVSLYLTFVIHHSNFDGWSWNIVFRELVMLYSRLRGKDSITLPNLTVQYKEFAHHHRHILIGDRFRVLSEFWRSKLENFEPLHLNTDKSRPPHFEYDGDDVNFIIGEQEIKELQKVAKQCKASLYAVLLALYGLMLASYTHQTNIPVGVPVTHRTHPQFESVVGFFVNLLVVRVDVTRQGIVGLVKRVMQELVDAQLHQDMPFQEVTKLLNTEHDPSRHPLVQTVFNYESNQADTLRTKENKGGFAEYQPKQTYSAAKFDLSATVSEMGSKVMVNFNYAISLFTKSTIMGMLDTYRHLIYGVCRLTEHGINDTTQLPLTPTCQGDGSHLPLLETQLAIHRDKEPAATLNKLFEAEVALASDCVAIVEGEKTITYGDLNAQANQLAWYLLSITDLKPDDHVALMLDKSISMLICIFAVWKAGAAYLPLDPTFPDNRIGTILQESKPKAVLLHSKYAARFESQGISLVTIDTTENISRQSTDDVKSNVQPENLAYSMFTSGTTGKPKGVSVKQNGVINLRNGLRMRYFGNCAPGNHSVLFLSNYIFDFSLEQIALSILSGQTLIIPPEHSFASNEFYDICNSYKLSYLSGTPSLLQQIDLRKLKFLKMVTAAGEELHASQYKKMRDSFHGTIHNAYGITETTVYNLITAFSANDGFENCLREVLPGNRIYLLGHNLQPVPLNAVGQLYLTGDCLARGYLNQPTLTTQRFIPNPFRTDEDAASGKFSHLYKTGDLARCRLDSSGNPYIEYMGRNDLQVKLRGLRIELSEVQRVMSSVPGVEDCAVIAKYMDDNPRSRVAQYLVGYYSTENPSGLEEIIIRHMKTKLPGYMIPEHLCHLRGPFPVTRTGKLDIQKLPDIDVTTGPQAVYSPPHNALQSKLCALWASVLGVERCGIDDDLFKMGGDSITSLHLVAQIHHRLSCKVTVRDLFEHRTIRKLYNNVLRNDLSGPTSEFRTEQGLVTGEAPLLPIQEWFLSKPLEKRDQWNHTFYIQTPELDVDRLSVAVQKLQDYHDAFRMRLKQKGETFVLSFPTEYQKIALRLLDVSSICERAAVNEALSEWQSGFNIENGPIGIIGYLYGYSDKTARVWFSIHHLAIDTVSWQILIRDLRNLYLDENLGSKGSSLRLWANSMSSYQGSKLEREYWDNLIAQSSESVAALPPSTGPRLKLGRVMGADKSASLLQHAGQMEASVLAAVGLALQDVEPMCCNMVTLEGHGREEDIDSTLDVSRTMGWFTSMYPFQIPHVKEADMLAAVAEIKTEVDRVPCHGAGYGALYGYVRHPLPSVSVNYLGQLTRTPHMPNDYWNLAIGDGEYAYGLTCSPEDAKKSSSAIDITVTCIDGRVAVDVFSIWDQDKSEVLISTIERGLDHIAEQLSSGSTSSTESPSCQLFTEETFTPYFEYRDPSHRQGPTLFLLPPGEGGAESYFNNIVKYLPKHNLVAFNNFYLHSKALQTFEELAEWYTDHIRRLQPQGPYHLLGWSFGGILAMEISRRLDDSSGKAISSLLFIDTYFDVRGATEEIGMAEKTILDKIHHVYDPEPARLAHMLSRVKDVVLFKAAKPNDKYTSDEQRLLYEYYHRTRANNLDKFIPIEHVSVMPLQGNTHFSWVWDVEQVKKVCSVIENILDNMENGHI